MRAGDARDALDPAALLTGGAGGAGRVGMSSVAVRPADERGLMDRALQWTWTHIPIREAAGRWLADHDGLDVLVNDAGVMAPPLRRPARGFELQRRSAAS